MEHPYYWGLHFHWFWFIPFLFMILIFFFACRMFRRACNWRRGSWRCAGWRPFGCCGPDQGSAKPWADDVAGEILDQRCAKDEITKEQYEQMKRDIESRQSKSRPGDKS